MAISAACVCVWGLHRDDSAVAVHAGTVDNQRRRTHNDPVRQHPDHPGVLPDPGDHRPADPAPLQAPVGHHRALPASDVRRLHSLHVHVRRLDEPLRVPADPAAVTSRRQPPAVRRVRAERHRGVAVPPAARPHPDDRHRDGDPEHRAADRADEVLAAAAGRRPVRRRASRDRHVHADAALGHTRGHLHTTQVRRLLRPLRRV